MKDVWGALSDATRREILTLLRDGDLTAGEIAEHFAVSKPTISHHLGILKQAELVTAQKSAQTITYSLNATVVQELMLGLAGLLNREREK